MDLSRGLLIASGNKGKIREISQILTGYKIVSVFDLGISGPEVEETGLTFKENALIKAKAYADISSLPSLADDSGLEVFALNNAPGVSSARYAGPGASDDELVAKLLREMKPFTYDKRGARFTCVVCLYDPIKKESIFEKGECYGNIALYPKGKNGFGYDPIFIPEGYKLSMAELDSDTKNSISHRGKAILKLKKLIKA